MTPQAYTDFLRNLRHDSENELEYHLRKADCSKCPGSLNNLVFQHIISDNMKNESLDIPRHSS